MSKALFLGAGASPGVPSLSYGWGDCNPNNPKNRRRRTSTLYTIKGVNILIDTSPDLREQLLDNNIRQIDALCYTHAHADHLHGIDELREINRISQKPLDVYAPKETMSVIRQRFKYQFVSLKNKLFYLTKPGLVAHNVKPNRPFYIQGIKLVPLKLLGHSMPSFGYIINDEIVHIADLKYMSSSAVKQIMAIRPKLLVLPLTILEKHRYHIGLEEALAYIEKLQPEKVVLNHMACECDYDYVMAHTPDNTVPAYDNLEVEI
jgi:phosphoribosyl 1,2-cyclic phosphate phosphodiesterase